MNLLNTFVGILFLIIEFLKKLILKINFETIKQNQPMNLFSMDKLKIVILFNKLIFSKMQTIHSPAMYETLVSHI
jgi:hypothetical protein